MAWQVDRIVVAVDGSEQSMAAAVTGADIARSSGASLDLITVVRPPEGWWGLEGAPPAPEALAEAITAGRQEVLDRTRAAIDATGISVDTVEELGDPVSAIIGHCENVGADLLVIGRRGAGLVERVLIGSVADRLAHTAPCPLLIVP
jgi:nucleotide-binding universal stress UspA family protein